MINKVLIIGSRLVLASVRPEEERIFRRAIDLSMPIEAYWELQKLMDEADYLVANEDSQADLKAIYSKIYILCASHALKEADRDWLYKKGSGAKVPD